VKKLRFQYHLEFRFMQKKKILIIDDYQPLLEEVVDFLSMEGYKVFSAKDGAEGVQVAISRVPDLIICDIEMPNLDGFAVFKTLEQVPATATIPFIFLTARAQISDFRKGLKLGVDDYIVKPFQLEELIMSISKRLEKHERLKNFNKDKLKALISNPLSGIYIYINKQFVLTNEKFVELTSYSKNDLNKLEIDHILMGNSDKISKQFSMCLQGLHDSFQLKLPISNKNKKPIFLEVFGKHIQIGNQNAIVGSVVEIPDSSTKINTPQQSDFIELNAIIEHLIWYGKKSIADEIMSIKKLLSFEENSKLQQIKEELKLTKREEEILKYICKGFTNSEIADKLFISNRTVDNHRAKLLAKTDSKNTASLVAFAVKNNLA